jgi:hypothetical protein
MKGGPVVRPFSKASVALLLVGATACANNSGASSGSPRISVTSPNDGATVQSPVRLQLSVTGAEIGPPDTGKMHFHVHIDDSDQYSVVTATTATLPVPAGEHTLHVVLAQPNHDETDTSTSVTITVSGGGEMTPTSSPTRDRY